MAYTGNYSFDGLNARHAAGDGAIRDMTNMSRRFYPAIASRKPRYGIGYWGTDFGGAYFGEHDYIVRGGALYDDGKYVCPLDPGDKQIAVLENIMYIYPDAIAYNTSDGTVRDWGAERVTNADTTAYAEINYRQTQSGGDVIDVEYHKDDIVLRKSGFAQQPFSPGEYLKIVISKTTGDETWEYVLTPETVGEQEVDGYASWYLEFPLGTFTDVTGRVGKKTQIKITITHAIPEMDFVFASDNRLWGAKGRNIYASALGQGMIWQDYDTLATSSWAATTATGDMITAACDFGGMPVFFTERSAYKIYGENPKEYQYARSDIVGVLAGEHKSVAVGAGYIYYLSRRGIYAWTGGIPELISEALGEERITEAVGGTDGAVYYLSCRQGGRQNLYTFDPLVGAWMREDDAEAVWLGMRRRDMCMVTRGGAVYLIGDVYSGEGTQERGMEYSMETSDYNDNGVVDKSAKHLLIQYTLSGGEAEVFVSYDGEPWHTVYTLYDTDGKKITSVIPLHPGRYRTMRIRIAGGGEIVIYYMVREVVQTTERPGGERNVYV